MAEKHGKSKSKIYNIWRKMKDRCLNPKSASYKYYGAKGITVCKEWIFSFVAFYEYCKTLDSFKEQNLGVQWSIDRIDGTKGYQKGNIRFTDKRTQQLNRKVFSNNKTGYRGIDYLKRDNVYRARVWHKGKESVIGTYKTALEAHEARQAHIKENDLKGYLKN